MTISSISILVHGSIYLFLDQYRIYRISSFRDWPHIWDRISSLALFQSFLACYWAFILTYKF